jgi:MHS family proline/betaine transporter-like MFS transporter
MGRGSGCFGDFIMTAVSIGTPTSAQSRKSVIGNVLEWYDFAVYGHVAAIIGRIFFPGQDGAGPAVVSMAVMWGLKETAFDELA